MHQSYLSPPPEDTIYNQSCYPYPYPRNAKLKLFKGKMISDFCVKFESPAGNPVLLFLSKYFRQHSRRFCEL